MNISDWNIWINLAFDTRTLHKNFDLICEHENFITECEGNISQIRINEHKLPRIIGEYRFSIWNIGLGISFGADFCKLFNYYCLDDAYSELLKLINHNEFHINYYKKIIFIHSYIILEEFRKKGVTEEFVEMIYKEYHNDHTAIIMLVKPLQNNNNDYDTYLKYKTVKYKEYYNSTETHIIPAVKYFELNQLTKKNDEELNEYKLFSKANNCGFKRIGESHLFILSPEKTINRMKFKQDNLKIINIE
jgi:hypothetical protein